MMRGIVVLQITRDVRVTVRGMGYQIELPNGSTICVNYLTRRHG